VTAAEADDRVLTAGTSAFVETQRLRTLARRVDMWGGGRITRLGAF
jgi:hypothetical protein